MTTNNITTQVNTSDEEANLARENAIMNVRSTFIQKMLLFNRYNKQCKTKFIKPLEILYKPLKNFLELVCDIADGVAKINEEKFLDGKWAKNIDDVSYKYLATCEFFGLSLSTSQELNWNLAAMDELYEDIEPYKWKFKDYIELIHDYEINKGGYLEGFDKFLANLLSKQSPLAKEAYEKLGYETISDHLFSPTRCKRLINSKGNK